MLFKIVSSVKKSFFFFVLFSTSIRKHMDQPTQSHYQGYELEKGELELKMK
jgi:hypothetical protein